MVEEKTKLLNEYKDKWNKIISGFEIAIAMIDQMQVTYEVFDGALDDFGVYLQLHNKAGGLLTVDSFTTRSNKSLVEQASSELEDVLSEMLERLDSAFDYEEMPLSAEGYLQITKKAGAVEIVWENSHEVPMAKKNSKIELDFGSWKALLDVAQSTSAYGVSINYKGSGDSMTETKIAFLDAEENEMISVPALDRLEIEELFEKLLQGPVNGFWLGLGGYGEIKILPKFEESFWSHWDNKTSTRKTTNVVVFEPTPIQIIGSLASEIIPVWS